MSLLASAIVISSVSHLPPSPGDGTKSPQSCKPSLTLSYSLALFQLNSHSELWAAGWAVPRAPHSLQVGFFREPHHDGSLFFEEAWRGHQLLPAPSSGRLSILHQLVSFLSLGQGEKLTSLSGSTLILLLFRKQTIHVWLHAIGYFQKNLTMTTYIIFYINIYTL